MSISTFHDYVLETLTPDELAIYNVLLPDNQTIPSIQSNNPIISSLLRRGYLRYISADSTDSPDTIVSVTSSLQRAQAIMDNNPVLQRSPGDLRRANIQLSTYLANYSSDEVALYKSYYEDEI